MRYSFMKDDHYTVTSIVHAENYDEAVSAITELLPENAHDVDIERVDEIHIGNGYERRTGYILASIFYNELNHFSWVVIGDSLEKGDQIYDIKGFALKDLKVPADELEFFYVLGAYLDKHGVAEFYPPKLVFGDRWKFVYNEYKHTKEVN